ncbi:MAG: phage portal protein [Ruthenibacterium sp.]
MFILPQGTQMTADLLSTLLAKHRALLPRYDRLRRAYEADHNILHAKQKDACKPDNRLVANFARYITDTMNGFFIGVPVKETHDMPAVAAYLDRLRMWNNQDDNNAELVKTAEIYGHAFELVYMDDDQIGVTHVPPQEAFAIYDDSIVRRQMFGVRYYTGADGVLRGSFSDDAHITHFHDNGGIVLDEMVLHYFGAVPLHELVLNEERKGIFEGVMTLCDAYDKAISEKANDVDYYADAYLSVLGAELDEATLRTLRDSRIINLSGADAEKVIVQFLQKPDADATQEHLIDRIERLIFMLSMVANINDESFGSASGVALQYKLQPMRNLASVMERKMTALLNRRYRMIFANPLSHMHADAWAGITYQFTRNLPANLLEESQIAGNLSGVTSTETQLSVLSCVDNVKDEMARKTAEAEKNAEKFTRLPRMEESDVLDTAAGTTMAQP